MTRLFPYLFGFVAYCAAGFVASLIWRAFLPKERNNDLDDFERLAGWCFVWPLIILGWLFFSAVMWAVSKYERLCDRIDDWNRKRGKL